MSLKPQAIAPIPERTQRVAQAVFPEGNIYMQMRDELGTFYTDEDFLSLYPRRGQPALAPWRLALVTVMQFVENLSDRQAAEAVRARIDWKYALGLELDDPGFDFSVLSEFRRRLVKGHAEQLLLDRMLEHFRAKKLLKARGRQRTDSTHVLAAIRTMNRLELVTETLRATLNDLATVAPDWLRSLAPAEWYDRYSLRAEQSRLPRGKKARKEYAKLVGHDGFNLLTRLEKQKPEFATRSRVQTLRQVWERHFAHSPDGKVKWLSEAELSRAAGAIESPYDTEARHSTKRELSWTGYKVHLTETCDPELPRLVTHVHTTVATTQDVSCTAAIQQALCAKNLLPSRHLVDTGYVDAELLVRSQEQHKIELFGPPRYNPSWQAREGGYDLAQFSIDWEKHNAVCPEGKVSIRWIESQTKPYGYPIVYARFASRDCSACPQRAKCVRSPAGRPRTLLLRSRAHHEALQWTRTRLGTEEGRKEYKKRAGVEGSLSQGVRRSGMRQTRYCGKDKTHFQHVAIAAGLNVVRVVEHLNAHPLAKTRVSPFAQLRN